MDSSAYTTPPGWSNNPAPARPSSRTKDPVELNGVDPMFADPDHGDYSPGRRVAADRRRPGRPSSRWFACLRPPPRACDGNDDGTIRRDIGAWEYRSDPSDDCTYSKVTINGPGGRDRKEPVLHLQGVQARPRPISARWTAPHSRPCTTPYTASGPAVGNHSLKVKAKDSYGNVQTPPTEKSFKVEAADKTALKVIGVKAPKQTRAATVKVSFKSNEKGSTFKRRLGKASGNPEVTLEDPEAPQGQELDGHSGHRPGRQQVEGKDSRRQAQINTGSYLHSNEPFSATLRRPVLLAIALVTALTMLAAWSAPGLVICVPDAGSARIARRASQPSSQPSTQPRTAAATMKSDWAPAAFPETSPRQHHCRQHARHHRLRAEPRQTVLNMVDTAGNNEGFHFTSVPGSTIREPDLQILSPPMAARMSVQPQRRPPTESSSMARPPPRSGRS